MPDDGRPRTLHDVSPLATLIERQIRRAREDGIPLDYAKIAARSPFLERRDVQKWAKDPDAVKLGITLDKRRGLALGLRVHPIEVDRAVAEQLDFWLEDLPYDYRLDPELSDSDRNQISAFINGIKARRGKRANG